MTFYPYRDKTENDLLREENKALREENEALLESLRIAKKGTYQLPVASIPRDDDVDERDKRRIIDKLAEIDEIEKYAVYGSLALAAVLTVILLATLFSLLNV
jgi:hypothetical protein